MNYRKKHEYTVVKDGEINIDIPPRDWIFDPNSFLYKFRKERLRSHKRAIQRKKELKALIPQRYNARVSTDGFNHIKSFMPDKSDNQIQHYINYIEWRLNRCLIHGYSILEYHEMTKTYKAVWFKGAKNNFTALKHYVFIPYINPVTGLETYIKGSSGKFYRLNPQWIEKYVTYELVDVNTKVAKDDPFIEMDKSNKKKCELIDAYLGSIKVRIDLLDHMELEETAKSEIPNYLIKIGKNQYEYSHSKKGLIQITFSSGEYPAFVRVESFILSKYYQYKLTRLISDTTKAKRNEYEGRLYHRLTNLPKRLYKFLMFCRESIAEVDMANCFPTLLILALTGQYDPYNLFQGNPYRKAFEYASWEKDNPIYHLVQCAKIGRFYDYITYLIYPKMSGEQRQLRRKYIKTQISKILFGKHNSTNWIKEKLKEKIPLFIKLIDTQKKLYAKGMKLPQNKDFYDDFSKGGEKSPFKAGNDAISIIGMRTESNLFLEKIFPELIGIPFLTKHDSILCPSSKLDLIQSKMINVLNNELGKRNYTLSTHKYELVQRE